MLPWIVDWHSQMQQLLEHLNEPQGAPSPSLDRSHSDTAALMSQLRNGMQVMYEQHGFMVEIVSKLLTPTSSMWFACKRQAMLSHLLHVPCHYSSAVLANA